jgi:hypothetical protein
MLPDEVLLGIFHFYAGEVTCERIFIEAWQTLVHVCQRWRNVVFGSPRRLDLVLNCTPGTHRDKLNVWPPLPLLILDRGRLTIRLDDIQNIVALLGHSDRVRRISLTKISSSHYLENVLAATQKPFPQLTYLALRPPYGPTRVKMPVVPDSFLGGSAPRLRKRRTHSVSRSTETTFVCYQPHRSPPFFYSSFRVHFTRGNARCPLHVDQPRITLP